MTNNLEKISGQIGELISMSRSTQSQVTTLFEKFDKVKEETIEQRGAIKMLGQQFTEHRAENSAAHKTLAQLKSEMDATKNKGKGLIVGLGLLGGGGGMAGLAAAFKNFLSGGT